MSKMGQTIVEIQELYYSGTPSSVIAKHTNTSVDFVEQIVKDCAADFFDYGGDNSDEPDTDFFCD
jgi:hypothetical protein